MIIEFECDVESCRLTETWCVVVPDDLSVGDMREFLYDSLEKGQADFRMQKVSDEQDRTIVNIRPSYSPSHD